jgi:nucleoside-diphosphate-sugar epimerase
MKIIVTGGTGFLGRHLVWRLAAAGHQVVLTGRDAAQAAQVIAGARGAEPAQFVRLEHGTDDASARLKAHAKDAEAIIHCAALASPWGSRAAFARANVASTREVLAACQAQAIRRLVHISSPSVYFAYGDRLGICEDDPLPPPVNEYARSKRMAEQLVLQAALPNGVILRPRAIFGPWDNALLPRLLRLMRYGRLPLLRGGRALIDLTYVDNVVDAVELALALPAAGATPVFNITNDEPIEAAALFARIADSFGLPIQPVPRPYAVADLVARGMELAARLVPGWEPPFTRYSLGTVAFSQTLDLRRARTELGYSPRVTLDSGIARTAQWWTETQRPR